MMLFTVLKDEGRSEKCYELTTLNYAPTYVAEEHGVDILVNKEGEEPKYMLSDKFGGGLIQIFDRMMNCSAILTTSLNDFAYREPGVVVAANKGLVGIKTAARQNRGGSTQRQSAEWQPYAAHFEFKQMLI